VPSNHQPSGSPLLRCVAGSAVALVAALAVALGVAPDAQAKDASFKATVQATDTVKSTITQLGSDAAALYCFPPMMPPPITVSQTIHARTTKVEPLTANMVDAGSSRGLVELGPSGSGYAQIPGVFGTIERHANNPPDKCGGPIPPQHCGTKSSKHLDVMVQPISKRLHGREHFQGLAVYFGFDQDPFSTCYAPESPHPAIVNVAKISTTTLFDKRRRQIVLHIKGTTPWHFKDNESKTVTKGTYSRSITLILRRTG
jgi:hypothetical protein